MDKGYDFESWLRFTLPWQLNLSPSKEVAMRVKFGPFADYVRPLANKAPEEFDKFFSELKKRIKTVYKWKAPKGTMVFYESYKGEWLRYPNGKFRHDLIQKKKNNLRSGFEDHNFTGFRISGAGKIK